MSFCSFPRFLSSVFGNCNFMLYRSFQVSAQMECKRHFSQSKPIEVLKGGKIVKIMSIFIGKGNEIVEWTYCLCNNKKSHTPRTESCLLEHNTNNNNNKTVARICSIPCVPNADKSEAQRQQKANSFTSHMMTVRIIFRWYIFFSLIHKHGVVPCVPILYPHYAHFIPLRLDCECVHVFQLISLPLPLPILFEKRKKHVRA